MKTLNKFLMGIANALSICSTVIVAAMLLLVVADVLLRTFFNMPITGSTEITQMMMAGMILGFAKSCLGNDNLKVDVVADLLPKKAQYVMDVITSIVCIGVSVLLTWRTVVNALYSKEKNLVYLTLTNVPKWLFILLLAVGFAGGIIGFILRIQKLHAEQKEGPADVISTTEEGGADHVK